MTNVVDENSGDNALNRARQTNVHPGTTFFYVAGVGDVIDTA